MVNSFLESASVLAAHHARPTPTESPYHYTPSKAVATIMLILFAISTLGHTAQAIRYRMWWLLPTACLCGVAELIGWSARYYSSIHPLLSTPFLIQICTTIIAPTPLVAANFIILGRVIARLGPQYSRLSPKWYSIIFCGCDIVALVLQGVGGAMASGAETPQQSDSGSHVMLGGIFIQLIAIIVYAALGTEFLIRYLKNKPLGTPQASMSFTEAGLSKAARGDLTGRLQIMLGALAFSTLCLFIRAIYRTAELSDGWHGKIISTQVYFNVLDGAMVILAIYTLNFAHPGLLLRDPTPSDSTKIVYERSSTFSETQLDLMKGRR